MVLDALKAYVGECVPICIVLPVFTANVCSVVAFAFVWLSELYGLTRVMLIFVVQDVFIG